MSSLYKFNNEIYLLEKEKLINSDIKTLSKRIRPFKGKVLRFGRVKKQKDSYMNKPGITDLLPNGHVYKDLTINRRDTLNFYNKVRTKFY